MDSRAILKATIGNFFKIPGTGVLLYPVYKRFIAGKTMYTAITKALELRKKGYVVTFAYLGGEHLNDHGTISHVVKEHFRFLCTIILSSALCGCEIAIKLSQFGIFSNPFLLEGSTECLKILRSFDPPSILFDRFFENAEKSGICIWVDAEELRFRERTFGFRNWLKHNRQNNGLALQVYAKDYSDFLFILLHHSIVDYPIRVCKGAYRETSETVEHDQEILRDRMVNTIESLIRNSKSPMIQIATHDETIIRMTENMAGMAPYALAFQNRVEYAFLYGRHETPLVQELLLKKGRRVNVYMPYGPKWKDFCIRRVIEKPDYLKLLLPWKK